MMKNRRLIEPSILFCGENGGRVGLPFRYTAFNKRYNSVTLARHSVRSGDFVL